MPGTSPALVCLAIAAALAAPQKIVDGAPLCTVIERDALGAIDDPRFAPAGAVDFMDDGEAVLGVAAPPFVKAYPMVLLDNHEIVNDTLGDTPIAATWCSLAGTTAVYERRAGRRTLTLGISGVLWKDAMVMFDRETGSLWSQVSGHGLDGELRRGRLQAIPSIVTTWARWKAAWPETLVLRKAEGMRRTAFTERYESERGKFGMLGTRNPDRRLGGKKRILGLEPGALGNRDPVVWIVERVAVLNDEVAGRPVLVVHDEGQPAARLFLRAVGDRTLHFSRIGATGRATDRETGSVWDLVSGRAVEGPLANALLEPVATTPAYWFAWAAFFPASEIRPLRYAAG